MGAFSRIEPHSRREWCVVIAALVLATLFLAADQLTKCYFAGNWKLLQTREIIAPVLNFTYVRNEGAAWSILSGYGWALLAFGLLAAAAMVFWFRKLTEACPERYFALLLVISGIIGNSIDRLFRGAVVDFIHVHYGQLWHYPVFNIADIAICCGVGVFMISGFCRKEQKDLPPDVDETC